MTLRQENAELLSPTFAEEPWRGPRARDVLPQRFVGVHPEIAELGDHAPAAHLHQRARRESPRHRIGIHARGLGEEVEVAARLRLGRRASRGSTHLRGGIDQRLLPRREILLTRQRPRAHRAPAIVGVGHEAPRVSGAEPPVVDAGEGRLGARGVVRLHPLGEEVVEVGRAAPDLADARARLLLRRARIAPENVARRDGPRQRRSVVVRQRAARLARRDLGAQRREVAMLHGARRECEATRGASRHRSERGDGPGDGEAHRATPRRVEAPHRSTN